ncbi:hypothetical protein [Chelativorans xinjiangense]|uniref:hypothetical protein n=1 Tax=Chelativorans xinjiangense TaxID=2681485 RepID=UPI001358F5E2|nr:hypothetical protein [Chelativorans xinjiangense]
MFAKLHHRDSEQIFSFWGYGETTQLSPGSGLYVGRTGVVLNHHFVLSVHQPEYEFTAGDYRVEVFARVVGKKRPAKLAEGSVSVTEEQAAILANRGGILFELSSDGQTYIGHARDEMPQAAGPA